MDNQKKVINLIDASDALKISVETLLILGLMEEVKILKLCEARVESAAIDLSQASFLSSLTLLEIAEDLKAYRSGAMHVLDYHRFLTRENFLKLQREKLFAEFGNEIQVDVEKTKADLTRISGDLERIQLEQARLENIEIVTWTKWEEKIEAVEGQVIEAMCIEKKRLEDQLNSQQKGGRKGEHHLEKRYEILKAALYCAVEELGGMKATKLAKLVDDQRHRWQKLKLDAEGNEPHGTSSDNILETIREALGTSASRTASIASESGE